MINPTFQFRDREILMSFGLLSELCQVIQSPDVVARIGVEHDIRNDLLVTLLIPRGKNGRMATSKEEWSLYSVDLTVDEALELTEWACEHVLDFFLKALRVSKAIDDRNKEKVKDLLSSLIGSTN